MLCSESPTWFEVGLNEGQDRVAGRQVTDTNAHEVIAHLRLPEQVIQLVRKVRWRDNWGIAERHWWQSSTLTESLSPGGRWESTSKTVVFDRTADKKNPCWLLFSCGSGINYTNTDSGGAELNAVKICRLGKYDAFCSFLLKILWLGKMCCWLIHWPVYTACYCMLA